MSDAAYMDETGAVWAQPSAEEWAKLCKAHRELQGQTQSLTRELQDAAYGHQLQVVCIRSILDHIRDTRERLAMIEPRLSFSDTLAHLLAKRVRIASHLIRTLYAMIPEHPAKRELYNKDQTLQMCLYRISLFCDAFQMASKNNEQSVPVPRTVLRQVISQLPEGYSGRTKLEELME